jgi:hypothetical protein
VIKRDEMGILVGDLDYGCAYPVTIIPHIAPFLYPCLKCGALAFHFVGEQHAGLGIRIPFARKPLVSTGKAFYFVCNTCMTLVGQLSNDAVAKLQNRILPEEIGNACDAFYSIAPDAPPPYAKGFAEHFLLACGAPDQETRDYLLVLLSRYRREREP